MFVLGPAEVRDARRQLGEVSRKRLASVVMKLAAFCSHPVCSVCHYNNDIGGDDTTELIPHKDILEFCSGL